MDKKNIFITICGMDGSGKTTIAKRIISFLEKDGYRVEFIHGHQYATAQKSFGAGDRQVRKYRAFFSLLTPLAFLDNVYTYFRKYRSVLKTKTLVCDRYFYDKVARLMFYGILNRHGAKIFSSFLPRPDFVFFLDVNEKTAVTRKGEYTFEEYQQFRCNYLFLARHLKWPIIDTNVSINASMDEIVTYLKKYI